MTTFCFFTTARLSAFFIILMTILLIPDALSKENFRDRGEGNGERLISWKKRSVDEADLDEFERARKPYNKDRVPISYKLFNLRNETMGKYRRKREIRGNFENPNAKGLKRSRRNAMYTSPGGGYTSPTPSYYTSRSMYPTATSYSPPQPVYTAPQTAYSYALPQTYFPSPSAYPSSSASPLGLPIPGASAGYLPSVPGLGYSGSDSLLETLTKCLKMSGIKGLTALLLGNGHHGGSSYGGYPQGGGYSEGSYEDGYNSSLLDILAVILLGDYNGHDGLLSLIMDKINERRSGQQAQGTQGFPSSAIGVLSNLPLGGF